MIRIFAKLGTSEKVLVATYEGASVIALKLNKQYGGDWIWVDKLDSGEILTFSDSSTYRGFHGKNERYAKGIETLKS